VGDDEAKEKETPAMEYSSKRMDLIIREVPPEIAHAFINFARNKWHGKQWVALKDLMQMADLQASQNEVLDRISRIESLVIQHDTILSRVSVQIMPEEQPEQKEAAEKKPRTCGGAKNGEI